MPEARLERTRKAYKELIKAPIQVPLIPMPDIPCDFTPEQIEVIQHWLKEFDELNERGKIATPSA